MRTLSRVAVLAFAVSHFAVAEKNWADKTEYDLFNQIGSETDPQRQIVLLYEWEARYPQSDLQRERLLLLASANKKIGKAQESFIAALQLLNRYPDDLDAYHLIVTVGPTLPQPSREDIETITSAANKILLPRPVPVAARSPQTPAALEPPATGLSPEAESQRVDAFIRDMRRASASPFDPSIARRTAAQAALEWIKTRKR
jgi:hypothetical protein